MVETRNVTPADPPTSPQSAIGEGKNMADLIIRASLQDDLEILWDFLAIAAYEPDAAAAKTLPGVAAYLAGWRRPGDFGFVAEQDDTVIGAAWARQFSIDDHKIAFAGDRTPWISIGVRPAARGQGIGEKLLHALIAEAGLRGLGLCLSVRSENPARRLYERLGFRVLAGSTGPNRAGGVSLGMFRPADDAVGGVTGIVEDQPQ
jgi:ribosomal protein S18 acetylase RimI-like enzyme